MSKIIVLGSGMVGSAMAIDLLKEHDVTVTDFNSEVLVKLKNKSSGIKTLQLDVTNKKELTIAILDFDLVICAVPGFLGFETLKTIIEAGKNVVDISFSPEDTMQLNQAAKDKNVTAIVDCGVAPGMGNIILGYYNEKMKVTGFECLVGGLPKVKKWPFYYKAPFSPIDVIEEYTRPARYVENGHLVTREPLTDCEYVEFDKVGTLESFNTDGLRSLLFTMKHIPDMKEKTLRYPGHVDLIKALKQSGFFGVDKIKFKGSTIVPLEFTGNILMNEWKLNEHEQEFTVMRITINGENSEGKKEQIIYNLYDEYDDASQTSSMARTTGYTATAAANLILNGTLKKKGVLPPELVGKYEECFHFILDYLGKRNIVYTSRIKKAK